MVLFGVEIVGVRKSYLAGAVFRLAHHLRHNDASITHLADHADLLTAEFTAHEATLLCQSIQEHLVLLARHDGISGCWKRLCGLVEVLVVH